MTQSLDLLPIGQRNRWATVIFWLKCGSQEMGVDVNMSDLLVQGRSAWHGFSGMVMKCQRSNLPFESFDFRTEGLALATPFLFNAQMLIRSPAGTATALRMNHARSQPMSHSRRARLDMAFVEHLDRQENQ